MTIDSAGRRLSRYRDCYTGKGRIQNFAEKGKRAIQLRRDFHRAEEVPLEVTGGFKEANCTCKC